MSDDMFDFGFTAVDESELQAVQDAQKAAGDVSVEARTSQDKLVIGYLCSPNHTSQTQLKSNLQEWQ